MGVEESSTFEKMEGGDSGETEGSFVPIGSSDG